MARDLLIDAPVSFVPHRAHAGALQEDVPELDEAPEGDHAARAPAGVDARRGGEGEGGQEPGGRVRGEVPRGPADGVHPRGLQHRVRQRGADARGDAEDRRQAGHPGRHEHPAVGRRHERRRLRQRLPGLPGDEGPLLGRATERLAPRGQRPQHRRRRQAVGGCARARALAVSACALAGRPVVKAGVVLYRSLPHLNIYEQGLGKKCITSSVTRNYKLSFYIMYFLFLVRKKTVRILLF